MPVDTMMRLLRKNRTVYLAAITLLCAICWVGYWVKSSSVNNVVHVRSMFMEQEQHFKLGDVDAARERHLPALSNLKQARVMPDLDRNVHGRGIWQQAMRSPYGSNLMRIDSKLVGDLQDARSNSLGVAPQGHAQHGVAPQGHAQHGVAPQGHAQQGVASQGQAQHHPGQGQLQEGLLGRLTETRDHREHVSAQFEQDDPRDVFWNRRTEDEDHFPVIKPQSNLAHDLGINQDDLDALRHRTENRNSPGHGLDEDLGLRLNLPQNLPVYGNRGNDDDVEGQNQLAQQLGPELADDTRDDRHEQPASGPQYLDEKQSDRDNYPLLSDSDGHPQPDQSGMDQGIQGIPENDLLLSHREGIQQSQQYLIPQSQQNGFPQFQQNGISQSQQNGILEFPQFQEDANLHSEQQVKVQPQLNGILPTKQVDLSQSQQGIPQFQQGIPQSQQGIPQFEQGIPQSQQGIPQFQQGVPQSQQGIPQLQQGISQSQQRIPQSQQGIPQFQQGISQFQQAIPQSQQGIPHPQKEGLPEVLREQMSDLAGQLGQYVSDPEGRNLLHQLSALQQQLPHNQVIQGQRSSDQGQIMDEVNAGHKGRENPPQSPHQGEGQEHVSLNNVNMMNNLQQLPHQGQQQGQGQQHGQGQGQHDDIQRNQYVQGQHQFDNLQGQAGYPQGQAGYPQGQAGYPQGQAGYPQGQVGYPQGQAGYPQGQAGNPQGFISQNAQAQGRDVEHLPHNGGQPYGVLSGARLQQYLRESHRVPPQSGRPLPLETFYGQKADDNAPYTLVHAGKASKAPADRHDHLRPLPEEVPRAAYIYDSKELPVEHRFRPSIGNGHLGTVVHNPHMFLGGFYNGRQEQSHRAEIPSTVSVRFTGTEPNTNFTRKHTLNVGEGVYSETCSHQFYSVKQRIFAHRTISGLMVVEIDLAMATYYPIILQLDLNKWAVSADITFKDVPLDDLEQVSMKTGLISAPETSDMTYDEVFVMYDHIPSTLSPPSGSNKVKWVFLTAVGADKQGVIDTYTKGSSLVHNGDQLYSSHVQAWSDLWHSGYIDIGGNITIAKAVYSAMYGLLSSIPLKPDPTWPFVGLSPSGLPLGDFDHPHDYEGRVYYDQELWMLPPVMTFHPDLAKVILGSRSRFAAKQGAARLAEDSGVGSSLRYPWQAGITGTELTDADDPHIRSEYTSGLISLAVLQYLYATNDTNILSEQNYGEILTGIANYYYRLLQDDRVITNSHGFSGVQSMDRYAHSVDDSVFTNAVAAIALSAPDIVYHMIGRTINLNYQHYSEDIKIPFDDSGNFHLEHSNYVKGHPISQADVVLLGYPLMRHMTADVRKNDLQIYEEVMDQQAPAMSWAMHAIGWLEVADLHRAREAFNKQFSYLEHDFQIWTEKGNSLGASNYLSAAGSFLQSIVNGYLGLRYHDDHLAINPVLPPGADHMHFVGVDYLGSSLDVWVWQGNMAILVMEVPVPRGPTLKVYTTAPLFTTVLTPGETVNIARVKARIMLSSAELPDDI